MIDTIKVKRTGKYVWTFVFLCALLLTLLGLTIFQQNPKLGVFFTLCVHVVLTSAMFLAARDYGDWLNPLTVLLFLSLVRFSLPWALTLIGFTHEVQIFSLLGLERKDWIWGEVLATLGLLGVLIGWMLPSPRFALRFLRSGSRPAMLSRRSGILLTSITGLVIGIASLGAFVALNATIQEAVVAGTFRSAEIQEGTGKYFYLALLSIASSVVLTNWLLDRHAGVRIALVPVILAMGAYWILGGRMRALTPLVAGLFSVWYARTIAKGSWKVPILGIVVVFFAFPIVLAMGQEFRGGGGLAGMMGALSLSKLRDAYGYFVLVDMGQLHSLALSSRFEPGVLGGKTFLAFLWPLTELLNLGGKSAGVFLVQSTLGFTGRKWGFHSTFIGDAYLNFGLVGVAVVGVILGTALKVTYSAFTQGALPRALYVIITVYLLRMAFESVEKYGEMLTVAVFAWAILVIGSMMSQVAGHQKATWKVHVSSW